MAGKSLSQDVVAAAAAAGAGGGGGGQDALWGSMIDSKMHAVVVIKMQCMHGFEGDGAFRSEGTGFVVDKTQGLILTNRHVATIGPSTHTVLFTATSEEVLACCVYADPVHDFAFLKFNPADLQRTTPAEIKLMPEHAKVGTAVRIVGNDAGEKLSILSATISRLDRNTPEYGRLTFNDLNTHYIGAASGTSGGSSGSPVLNVRGECIALNAGGASQSNQAMYLPVYAPKRALGFLQRQLLPPRGELLANCQHRDLNEVRDLGVDPEALAEVVRAHPGTTGLLVVRDVLQQPRRDLRRRMAAQREGAAAGGEGAPESKAEEEEEEGEEEDPRSPRPGDDDEARLQPGDILLKIGDEWCGGFPALEAAANAVAEAAVSAARLRRQATGTDSPTPAEIDLACATGAYFEEAWDIPDSGDEGEGEEEEEEAAGLPLAEEEEAERPVAAEAPVTADEPSCPAANLATYVDGSVPLGSIRLTVWRAAEGVSSPAGSRRGRSLELRVPVADAHSLIPRRLLSIGGAVLTEVSYSRALFNQVPAGTVVLGPTGFVFDQVGAGDVQRGASRPSSSYLLWAVNGKRLSSLAHAAALLSALREGEHFTVLVGSVYDPHAARFSVTCRMSRAFHSARLLSRVPAADAAVTSVPEQLNRWEATPLPPPPPAAGSADEAWVGPEDVQMAVHAALDPWDAELVHADDDDEEDDGEGEWTAEQQGELEEELRALMGGAGGDPNQLAAALAAAAGEAGPGGMPATIEIAVDGGEAGMQQIALISAGGDAAGAKKAAAAEQAAAVAEFRTTRLSDLEDHPAPVRRAALSLVSVQARQPFAIEGMPTPSNQLRMAAILGGDSTTGCGVLVDKANGLFVVDRNTVPICMSEVLVTIGTTSLPARVVFLHPAHNFAIVRVANLRSSGWAAALEEIRFAASGVVNTDPIPQRQMESVADAWPAMVASILLDPTSGTVSVLPTASSSATYVPVGLPAYISGSFNCYRSTGMVTMGTAPAPGIVVDRAGRLRGLHATFGPGEAAVVNVEWMREACAAVLRRIRGGVPLRLRRLSVQMDSIGFSEAQMGLGLSQARTAQLFGLAVGNEMLVVEQTAPGSRAEQVLREGDLIIGALPPAWLLAEDEKQRGVAPPAADPATGQPAWGRDEAGRVRLHLAAHMDKWKAGAKKAVERMQLEAELSEASMLGALGIRAARALTALGKAFGGEEEEADKRRYLPRPVLSATDLMRLAQRSRSVQLLILREREELVVEVPTDSLDVRAASSKDVLCWCGYLMHAPEAGILRRSRRPMLRRPAHRNEMNRCLGREVEPAGGLFSPGVRPPVAGKEPAQLVVTRSIKGSPAVGASMVSWVVSINGTPTPTLEDALWVVTRLPDRQPVRIEFAEVLTGAHRVRTVRPAYRLHPTARFVHGPDFQWRRFEMKGAWPLVPAQTSSPLGRWARPSAQASPVATGGAEGEPAEPAAEAPRMQRQSTLSYLPSAEDEEEEESGGSRATLKAVDAALRQVRRSSLGSGSIIGGEAVAVDGTSKEDEAAAAATAQEEEHAAAEEAAAAAGSEAAEAGGRRQRAVVAAGIHLLPLVAHPSLTHKHKRTWAEWVGVAAPAADEHDDCEAANWHDPWVRQFFAGGGDAVPGKLPSRELLDAVGVVEDADDRKGLREMGEEDRFWTGFLVATAAIGASYYLYHRPGTRRAIVHAARKRAAQLGSAIAGLWHR